MSGILTVLAFCFLLVFGILAIIFLVVPLLKGLGWVIGGIFNGLGWVVRHIFEFVGGMLTDAVRFVGAIIAFIVLIPMSLLNVIIGRWSAAGHYFRSMKREVGVGTTCLYRVVLQRPLRFVLLGGLLEGLEERVNEAVEAAPTSDTPRRRTGTFEGYTIVGSLPGGGSGAKLYIAEPDERRRARNRSMPRQVVIKSFAISDGSSLPQIVRESRALEAAKQLGLVLEHGMDEHRFFYIMPYRRGEHLGVITRQLHGASDRSGLSRKQLGTVLGFTEDLLQTLSRYHEGGLWHKDVKPDNIIVQDSRAHLVDLGLVTPLRSAMTLTTHGTEYFRDPEMVRMALRGVKVHQVDGAKFDIYAAGAVLYFMTENTFPAHGGLSSFSKSSPEAVRWIVRRAMTDYNKRYETAQLMLADVAHVQAAADPWTVKPAELPSMRGVEADEGVTIAAAGSPTPPPPPPMEPETPREAATPSVAAWGLTIGPSGIKAGRIRPEVPAAEQHEPETARRPDIRVTNWWTGGYEVLDPGDAASPDPAVAGDPRAEARAFRQQVRGMRQRSDDLRQQVRGRAMSARRAAREQIKEARTRAREIQRRAREHRHRAAPGMSRSRQPSAVMAFLALTVLSAGALLAITTLRRSTPGVEQVLAMDGFDSATFSGRNYLEADIMGPLTLLLINDHPAAANAVVKAEVDRLVSSHRNQGWEVLVDDRDAEVEVRKLLPPGATEKEIDLSPLLRRTLAAHDLGGIILFTGGPGEGEPHERTRAHTIILPHSDTEPALHFEVRLPDAAEPDAGE